MSLADRVASSRTIRLFCLIAIAALAFLRLPSEAKEYIKGQGEYRRDTNEPANPPAAVATDIDPGSAEEVAKEVLRLQEQLGGSIVNRSPQLSEYQNHAQTPVPPSYVPSGTVSLKAVPIQAPQVIASQKPVSKVGKLREAAWQLDTTANCLENLDLYDQADALRGLSSRLRRDAREMKQQQQETAVKLSSYELPEEH